jgi:hypothetical protein
MKTFAYCCASYREAVRKAAGVLPMCSPPHTSKSFWIPTLLENRDLLYFDLHGHAGDAQWYGDNALVALRASQIRGADLGGAVVFAANCYLSDDDSPMLDALLDAGASWVVGGQGPNYGAKGERLVGANLLGMWFHRLLELGFDVLDALRLAKARMLASRWVWMQANRDARAFRAYHRI